MLTHQSSMARDFKKILKPSAAPNQEWHAEAFASEDKTGRGRRMASRSAPLEILATPKAGGRDFPLLTWRR